MTQEQKARAYDEALEKARARYDKEPTDGYVGYANQILKELFPQLAESEDERLLNTIICGFETWKSNGMRTFNNTSVDDIISYLERRNPSFRQIHNSVICDNGLRTGIELGKQKDQKSTEWDELQADFRNINEAFENGKKEVVDNPESYGLCRPAEWSGEDEKLLDFWLDVIDRNDWRMDENFCKASREFINRLKSLSPQAKQEWNEEDEEMFDAFIHKLEVCDLLTNKEVMWAKLRLKSLRPQPRQEWSEKEKKMLAVISYKISQHQGNDERSLFTPDEAEFIDGMEDKLKSLRPDSYKNCNSRWKPSEEQMEVLRRALHINPASGKLHYLKENEVCILQGLLKQLEKL